MALKQRRDLREFVGIIDAAQTSVLDTPPASPRPPTSMIDVTRRTAARSSTALRTRSMCTTKSTVWAMRLHTANSGRLAFDFDT